MSDRPTAWAADDVGSSRPPTSPATRLTVEHLVDPTGLGVTRPRLSWWLPADATLQDAYRIEVGGVTSEWVSSTNTSLVEWPTAPLVSRQRVDWRVQVRTDRGEHPWSVSASIEAGLLTPADWVAKWITPEEPQVALVGQRPAFLLRREFELDDVEAAMAEPRLYATAHGVYECFLNGRRVGDVELAPGNTTVSAHVMAQAYDVSGLLRAGRNVWEVLLSDGFYRGASGILQVPNSFGDSLAFIGQLHVGARTVGTDDAWTGGPSQVVAADLMLGQTTDFTVTPMLRPVSVVDHDRSTIAWSPAPPVRAVEELRPVSVRRLPSGRQVIDLGQNINGWVRLSQLGPRGTRITLVFGEHCTPEGDVTRENLEFQMPYGGPFVTAGMVDRVVSGGGVDEVFEPRHTVHGFRYVAVDGCPVELTAADVTGVVVHTDFRRTGWFECSDDRLNRLHDAVVWSFRDNACDIPTDCPHRERAGWTGDYQIFAKTATYLYDVAGFSVKWLDDVVAEQRPDGVIMNIAPNFERRALAVDPEHPSHGAQGSAGWGDAITIVPWQLWQAYGDRQILDRYFPAMCRWVDFAARSAASGRHPSRAARSVEPAAHEQFIWDTGYHWGEWHEPGVDLWSPSYWSEDRGPLATSFLYESARITAEVAALVGESAAATRYGALAAAVRDAWQREFVRPDGSLVPDTQANHVRALAFRLVPDHLRRSVAARLAALVRSNDNHLTTGFLATGDLLLVLAEEGQIDAAYDLLLQSSPPSWLAMIDRGATTIWESWEGVRDDGSASDSLNHYSKGAVISFLHRHVAGIRPVDGQVGHRHFTIAPTPGGALSSAEGVLDTPFGRVVSSWRISGDRFELEATVPPGTTAEVVLPDGTTATQTSGMTRYSCLVR